MRALLLVPLLAGCSMLQPNGAMTADQLKAAAADKNASVVCAKGAGPWGTVVSTYVNVDKSSVTNGTVTVDAECKVSVTTADKK